MYTVYRYHVHSKKLTSPHTKVVDKMIVLFHRWGEPDHHSPSLCPLQMIQNMEIFGVFRDEQRVSRITIVPSLWSLNGCGLNTVTISTIFPRMFTHLHSKVPRSHDNTS